MIFIGGFLWPFGSNLLKTLLKVLELHLEGEQVHPQKLQDYYIGVFPLTLSTIGIGCLEI